MPGLNQKFGQTGTLAGIILFIAVGCSGGSGKVRGTYCSDVNKKYFRKSVGETYSEFEKFDIETQYAIYICGNQYIEPPLMQFGLKFALEGEHVVGYLTARLEETESEPTIRDIISVFRWMTIKKTYDVAGNTNLMKIMESKKNQIKEPMWRSFVEKELSEIKKQATN